jgi:hypothetical protein
MIESDSHTSLPHPEINAVLYETANTKRDATAHGVRMGGVVRAGLLPIFANTDNIVSSLEQEFGTWVDEQVNSALSYLNQDETFTTKDQLREAYREGAKQATTYKDKTIRAKRIAEGNTQQATLSERMTQRVTIGYINDFFTILATCKQYGISPIAALRGAKNVFGYDTAKMREIIRDTQDPQSPYFCFTNTILSYGFYTHTDAVAYFERVIQIFAELREERNESDCPYSVFTDSELLEYASKHKDSKRDLILAAEEYTKLRQDKVNDDFSDSIIRSTIVSYSKKAQTTLNKARRAIETMRENPDNAMFSAADIQYTALHNPANPQGALDRARNAIRTMRESPENAMFTDADIHYVALNTPTTAQGVLDRAKTAVRMMRENPNNAVFTDADLHYTALYSPANPQGALDRARELIRNIRENPDNAMFTDADIHDVALNTPTNAQGVLDRAKQAFQILQGCKQQEEFNVPDFYLQRIVLNYPQSYRSIFDNGTAEINECQRMNRYKHIPRSYFFMAMTSHPNNIRAHLDSIRFTAGRSQARYEKMLSLFYAHFPEDTAFDLLQHAATSDATDRFEPFSSWFTEVSTLYNQIMPRGSESNLAMNILFESIAESLRSDPSQTIPQLIASVNIAMERQIRSERSRTQGKRLQDATVGTLTLEGLIADPLDIAESHSEKAQAQDALKHLSPLQRFIANRMLYNFSYTDIVVEITMRMNEFNLTEPITEDRLLEIVDEILDSIASMRQN